MRTFYGARLLANGGPAGNPDLPYTALQVHFDGTTVVDSSPSPKSISLWGGASLSTTSPKFGARCLRTDSNLDGAGILVADPDLVVGTGDFNYSFWMKLDSTSSEQVVLSTISSSSGANGFYLDYHPTYGLLHYSPIGGGLHYSSGFPTAGVWEYVEYSRTSGQSYLFLGNAQIATWADSNNYSNNQLFLGGITYTPIGAVPAIGYWDELRLLVGRGGNTAGGFTPPTAAYSDV